LGIPGPLYFTRHVVSTALMGDVQARKGCEK